MVSSYLYNLGDLLVLLPLAYLFFFCWSYNLINLKATLSNFTLISWMARTRDISLPKCDSILSESLSTSSLEGDPPPPTFSCGRELCSKYAMKYCWIWAASSALSSIASNFQSRPRSCSDELQYWAHFWWCYCQYFEHDWHKAKYCNSTIESPHTEIHKRPLQSYNCLLKLISIIESTYSI